MSIGRTTIGISRWLEGVAAGKPGRKNTVLVLMWVMGLAVIGFGLALAFGANPRVIIGLAAVLSVTLLLSLMIVRHDWLFMFALVAGHSVFYGKPPSLGLRVADGPGPADVMLFLSGLAGLVYWYGRKDAPKLFPALVWPPIMVFAYTAVYAIIAYFFWDRRDVALLQVFGWFYWVTAFPSYLCFTIGKIWRPWFIFLICGGIAAAALSTFVEMRILDSVIIRTGYGGVAVRSWGDAASKTNALALVCIVILSMMVIVSFAKKRGWTVWGSVAAFSGLLVVFLDRGRIHYAGVALAMLLMLLLLPAVGRYKLLLRGVVTLALIVISIQLIGGKPAEKFNEAVEKAVVRIELSKPSLVQFDPGLKDRERNMRQAGFYFLQNPVFGGGPGTIFDYSFDWNTMTNIPMPFMDNSVMYPAAVGGIVAVALIGFCYACFTGLNLWAIGRLRNPLHRALATVPICYLVFLLVCSWVTWWMVDRFHITMFAVTTGISLALVYHERIHGSDQPVVDF